MLARIIRVVLGVAIAAAGAAMLVLPGPGLVTLALGVGLVLAQFEPGRRVISRIRLWARGRFGSQPVRDVERRLPRDVVGNQNTQEMRLDLEEYERRRRRRREGDDGGRRNR